MTSNNMNNRNNNLENYLQLENKLYSDMGSRKLTENEMERIKYIADPIYNSVLSYETMDKPPIPLWKSRKRKNHTSRHGTISMGCTK